MELISMLYNLSKPTVVLLISVMDILHTYFAAGQLNRALDITLGIIIFQTWYYV